MEEYAEDKECDREVNHYLQDLSKTKICFCRKYAAKRNLCRYCTDSGSSRTSAQGTDIHAGSAFIPSTDGSSRRVRVAVSDTHHTREGVANGRYVPNATRTQYYHGQRDQKLNVTHTGSRTIPAAESRPVKRIKPTLIPAVDFIGRYYLPELMKSGGITPLSGIPSLMRKHLEDKMPGKRCGDLPTSKSDINVETSQHFNDVTGRFQQLDINNNNINISA